MEQKVAIHTLKYVFISDDAVNIFDIKGNFQIAKKTTTGECIFENDNIALLRLPSKEQNYKIIYKHKTNE